MSVSLTGDDTIIINGHVFHDLADADCGVIAFPNDLMATKASKNGNTLFAKDEKGRLADVTLRLLAGSADDIFLNSALQSMTSDVAGFILMVGSFTKRVGDGTGKIKAIVYQALGGVFKKQIGAKTSAEGDLEQSVAVYNMQFASVTSRSIQ